ncbi:unnamed protein product [Blepharisma stoltei]|uniref:Uncharacterized protein n=1 Tax=Blepharisma stoltei TaxID=1481888 RepID=A0AAU9IET0_9CILI|nr:unnamed protein product [Blepharisma stoltei]
MVTQNLTTLEYTWRKHNIFDMGWQNNFTQIFGKSCLFWFLPIPSASLTGSQFPIKIRTKTSGYLYYNDKFLI